MAPAGRVKRVDGDVAWVSLGKRHGIHPKDRLRAIAHGDWGAGDITELACPLTVVLVDNEECQVDVGRTGLDDVWGKAAKLTLGDVVVKDLYTHPRAKIAKLKYRGYGPRAGANLGTKNRKQREQIELQAKNAQAELIRALGDALDQLGIDVAEAEGLEKKQKKPPAVNVVRKTFLISGEFYHLPTSREDYKVHWYIKPEGSNDILAQFQMTLHIPEQGFN
jgi:hypothetical protein